jgi:protein-disulfide isomerase
MFTDYACGYCRTSLPDINKLIADDPKLKVVWREIPILGPGSEVAAKASLAAARQGAFKTFHERMFAAGVPNGDKVSAVLRSMGLDLRKLQQELAGKIDQSLATPTFVVNGQMLKGAVGYDALKQAIADARTRTKV